MQNEFDRITLNLVADRAPNAETLASLEIHLRKDVNTQMVLEVNVLDDIPRTVSGKHQFVIGMGSRPEN